MQGTLICFGDSNTYGYDPTAFSAGRYPKEGRWPEILAMKTGLTVLNHGICGREIPHERARLAFACRQLAGWSVQPAPIELWVMLGTNDLLMNPRFTAEDAAARMERFLGTLQAEDMVSDGRITLRLLVPPVMQYGAWVDEERVWKESRRMDDAYQALADRLGVLCIRTSSWKIPVVFDGVHFSEEGHRLFAEHLLGEVRKLRQESEGDTDGISTSVRKDLTDIRNDLNEKEW